MIQKHELSKYGDKYIISKTPTLAEFIILNIKKELANNVANNVVYVECNNGADPVTYTGKIYTITEEDVKELMSLYKVASANVGDYLTAEQVSDVLFPILIDTGSST